MTTARQVPTTILPTLAQQTASGLLTLSVADAAQHASDSFEVWALQEKMGRVIATMVGAPGPLNVWIETSADDSAGSYVQLGAVSTLVATGGLSIPWTTHSEFARIVAQAPLWAAGSWTVQVLFEGGTK